MMQNKNAKRRLQDVFMGIALLLCLPPLCASNAVAADAVTLYLELTGTTATIWPGGGTDYLRGRVILLDANNDLATTFAGKTITDCQLVFQSQRFGSDARFSFQPATDRELSASDWESAAESVTKRPERAWQEFAVSYDNIRDIDDDTLIVTLKTGTSTLAVQRGIKVQGPPANCYVVRTGGLVSVNLLAEIPGKKNDGGSVKTSGSSTIVDVYAAFYNKSNGKYYYTNNLPDAFQSVTVSGKDISLTNGHAQESVTVSVTSGNQNDPSKFNSDYTNGISKDFSASSSTTGETRWIGVQVNDVTRTASGDEYVYVTGQGNLGEESSSDTQDTGTYKPTSVATKITIVGLPVNEVDETGKHKESGTGGIAQNPGKAEINPNDAFILLGSDKTKKLSRFKTAGNTSQKTYIYGAIVGYNGETPASFAQGLTATFYLKKKGDTAVNASGAVLRAVTLTSDNKPVYYAGSAAGTTSSDGTAIQAKYAYQCFLPFQITATADNGTPSLENLYISKVKLSDGSELSRSIYEEIDTANEGVTFIAQNKVGAITLTDIDSLDGTNAGDDAEVKIKGINGESSFDLRVIKGSSDLKIGDKGSSSPGTIVTLPVGSDGVAKKDVAFFTALVASITSGSTQVTAPIFAFKGLADDTNVVQGYPRQAGASIEMQPARPSRFPVSSLSAGIATINSYVDPTYDHDTLFIKDAASCSDAFGNAYSELKDADISLGVYLPNADGSASSTTFPGASAKIDEGKNILVQFDPERITEGQETAVLKITSSDGSKIAATTINLRAAQKVKMSALFVPVPGITDTPVAVSLADQANDMIEPITVTAANDATDKGKYGNKITLDLESDNGTVDGSTEKSVAVKTTAPVAVVKANPNTGKKSMLLTGEADDFEKGTLLLSFIPDFEKPVVADIIEGNCRIDIEVMDNQQVNLAGTAVTIYNASGENITATLTRFESGDGTTSGTITFSGFPKTDADANYTIEILARDAWNNERTVTRIIAIPCVELPTSCREVDPSYAIKGETKEVTIKADNTNFTQGTTQVSFSCDNATVTGTRVVSPTELVVTVQIGGTAPPVSSDIAVVLPSLAQEASGTTTTTTTPVETGTEICDITITTGSETVTCERAFEILSEPLNPQCIGVTPSSVQSGQATNIVITGTDTSFTDTSAVSFSCPEISVTGKKADSSTQMTVAISSSPVAATTTCAVTAGDLSCGELTLLPPAGGTCTLSSLNRSSIRAGRFLPRVFILAVRGSSGCSFSRTSQVSFGTDAITARTIFGVNNTLYCLVTVKPRTTAGAYEVTVDGAGGVNFTVQ